MFEYIIYSIAGFSILVFIIDYFLTRKEFYRIRHVLVIKEKYELSYGQIESIKKLLEYSVDFVSLNELKEVKNELIKIITEVDNNVVDVMDYIDNLEKKIDKKNK